MHLNVQNWPFLLCKYAKSLHDTPWMGPMPNIPIKPLDQKGKGC